MSSQHPGEATNRNTGLPPLGKPKKARHSRRRIDVEMACLPALPSLTGHSTPSSMEVDESHTRLELLLAERAYESTLLRLGGGASSTSGIPCDDGTSQLQTLRRDPEVLLKRIGSASVPSRFLPPLRNAVLVERQQRLESMHAWWSKSMTQVAETLSRDMPLCRDLEEPRSEGAQAIDSTDAISKLIYAHPSLVDAPDRIADVCASVNKSRLALAPL